MFFAIFILFHQPVDCGGVNIVQCSNGAEAPRPSLPADYCRDLDSAACSVIFPWTQEIIDSMLNPEAAYQIPEACEQPSYAALSIRQCPRSCTKCCLTKQFNCSNGQLFIKTQKEFHL
ncbi:unnamed protein product [Dracunculus medinensis]|uniref:ShKT domain-containing protein n=1 Tax=Dracunculus medinensis TaxID=318479 RepID=A0A0N4URU2_DRAME|nr:unnamed protein product [Dracunculus medinensis]